MWKETEEQMLYEKQNQYKFKSDYKKITLNKF